MARPRTATNVLQLKGAFKANPSRGRERENEPVVKAGIGSAPEHLGEKEKLAWDEIVSLAPHGVLGDCDRLVVECIAELLAMKRTVGMSEFPPPLLSRLEAMLGKIGFTPSDRSKVKVPRAGEKKNEFSDF